MLATASDAEVLLPTLPSSIAEPALLVVGREDTAETLAAGPVGAMFDSGMCLMPILSSSLSIELSANGSKISAFNGL